MTQQIKQARDAQERTNEMTTIEELEAALEHITRLEGMTFSDPQKTDATYAECLARYADEIRDTLTQAIAIKKGDMVVVPREPTRKMLNAAIDAHGHKLCDISGIGLRISPQQMFEISYKAMIAAQEDTDVK